MMYILYYLLIGFVIDLTNVVWQNTRKWKNPAGYRPTELKGMLLVILFWPVIIGYQIKLGVKYVLNSTRISKAR